MRRKNLTGLASLAVMFAGCTELADGEAVRLTGSIVEYGRGPAGAPLRGMIYKPDAEGPFPVLLYAHGSAPGYWSNEAFEEIAREFTSRGWAVFAPYRRGQGLSQAAGANIGDQIVAARQTAGPGFAQAEAARLLATDHLADQTKAFAWLLRQSFTDRSRIATMGNSFGGIIALLSAEHLPVCAAIDAAGAADSWEEAPAIRELMLETAAKAQAPVLFLQAENDFNVAPSTVLHATMVKARKVAELRVYPPFGNTASEGHSFAYKGASIWGADGHAFLNRACP